MIENGNSELPQEFRGQSKWEQTHNLDHPLTIIHAH
jgi:hypothetical protein